MEENKNNGCTNKYSPIRGLSRTLSMRVRGGGRNVKKDKYPAEGRQKKMGGKADEKILSGEKRAGHNAKDCTRSNKR